MGLSDYVQPSLAVDVAALTVLPGQTAAGRLRLGVVVVTPLEDHDDDGGSGWRLPGAFVHAPSRWSRPHADRHRHPSPPEEVPPLRAAVARALAKAGLRDREPQQLHVFDHPDRDERGWVISVAHRDTLPRSAAPGEGLTRASGAGHEVAVAVVEEVEEVEGGGAPAFRALLDDEPLALPYDHALVLSVAVADLRDRYAADPDPGHLLPDRFTLRDLRRVHEAVAGTELLPDTFRRHYEHGFIGLEEWSSGGVGRPAQYFRRRTAEERLPPNTHRPARSNAGRAARSGARGTAPRT